jgi:NADH-quinone oxidoreductase subunit A
MQVTLGDSVLLVLGIVTAAVAFIGFVFGLNALLSPRDPTPEKVEPYECGMVPQGQAWLPFRMRFSTIALLFVVFDAETALFFAVAPHLRGSVDAVVTVAPFAALMAVGLAYAWRKGALTWPS